MIRALTLLTLLGLTLGSLAQAGGGEAPTRPAPAFSLTELDGKRLSLTDLQGQAVILQFGDVACAPCRENDRLLRLYQFEYLSHGLVVLSLYGAATPAQLRRYDAQFTFGTLVAPDPDGTVARRYQVRGLPTTIFIDRDGVIQDVRRGQLTEEKLLHSLQRIL